MKKLLLISLIALFVVSCKPYIEYDISYSYAVPDSLKNEYKEYIQQIIKNASYETSLSGGKVRDLVQAAKVAADNIYMVKMQTLLIVYAKDFFAIDYAKSSEILFEDLNEEQLKIFNQIMHTGKTIRKDFNN